MFFSSNLRLLRKRRNQTQEDLATALGLKRSTLNNYENQIAQPAIDVLLAMSGYFNVAVDTLLRMDLQSLSETQLRELESGSDAFIKGSKLRVLTSTVGTDNEENIELVPQKAKAGYMAGFSDPEYIENLPVFRLPFLRSDRKYRTFQISGDSMLPIPDGSWVTGEFVQDWTSIKSGEACILLSSDDGLAFNVVENHLADGGFMKMRSLNPLNQPYSVKATDIRELWRFVHYISNILPLGSIDNAQLMTEILSVKQAVNELRKGDI